MKLLTILLFAILTTITTSAVEITPITPIQQLTINSIIDTYTINIETADSIEGDTTDCDNKQLFKLDNSNVVAIGTKVVEQGGECPPIVTVVYEIL